MDNLTPHQLTLLRFFVETNLNFVAKGLIKSFDVDDRLDVRVTIDTNETLLLHLEYYCLENNATISGIYEVSIYEEYSKSIDKLIRDICELGLPSKAVAVLCLTFSRTPDIVCSGLEEL